MFVHAITLGMHGCRYSSRYGCRYGWRDGGRDGCMYFLTALVLVCVDVMVGPSA